MTEIWQLYDETGKPRAGQGASKEEVFSQGLLHAAAHVWIWRNSPNGKEVLLQKRAANKLTWPNLFDISAAGHIDLGEAPLAAAIRETQEEIGHTAEPQEFSLIKVWRMNTKTDSEAIENEFQYLYIYQLPKGAQLVHAAAEVALLVWKSLDDFADQVLTSGQGYVPHSADYYKTVIAALRAA